MAVTNSGRTGSCVRPRVKLWFESGGDSVLCSGMEAILKAVDETGSIKHAAARVGRSYRFIWSRIKDAEDALGGRLVKTQVGGRDRHRSELTNLARDLLREFGEFRQAVFHLTDDVFAARLKTLARRSRRSEGGGR